jgi:hypothetical protein
VMSGRVAREPEDDYAHDYEHDRADSTLEGPDSDRPVGDWPAS